MLTPKAEGREASRLPFGELAHTLDPATPVILNQTRDGARIAPGGSGDSQVGRTSRTGLRVIGLVRVSVPVTPVEAL